MAQPESAEPQPPSRTTGGPRGIHPAIRNVWLWSNAVVCLVFAGILGAAEYSIESWTWGWRFPIISPALMLLVWLGSAVLVRRQWAVWRYEVTDFEVILAWGVYWQTHRFVPRDRIQHVDVTSGPLARRFGLVHVHLYVAGAHGAVGAIPGLTPQEAEDLRGMLVESQADHV